MRWLIIGHFILVLLVVKEKKQHQNKKNANKDQRAQEKNNKLAEIYFQYTSQVWCRAIWQQSLL